MKPRRPVLRYFGGKWKLAPWIISHFPEHRVYIEPFGGAASVLMQKPRTYAEIYNEIDGEVVNVFRVLRDPSSAAELLRLVELTPFARDEFNEAWRPAKDSIEQARRTLLKAFAGFGSDSVHRRASQGMRTSPHRWRPTTGFRTTAHRHRGTTPATDWANYTVVIENRPALDVIRQYDDSEALIYLDPPYVLDSRKRTDHGYRQEMSDEDHRELARVLHGVAGMVIISGYQTELYDELYAGWRRVETVAHGTGAHGRGCSTAREVLWISPRIPVRQAHLFEEATGYRENP
jgi:DNA adenine methylase